MIELTSWLNDYQQAVKACFGSRIAFVGLQGSRGRGEAGERSDIDVVLILDHVAPDDLSRYREAVAHLPHRELLCGFISGRAELRNWSRPDLFQFYFDTVPLYGRLGDIVPHPTRDDARQAALMGACNLYHACSHNYLHAGDVHVLRALYKSACFALQADHYCKTGTYIKYRASFLEVAQGLDRQVLLTAMNPADITMDTFEESTRTLLAWTGNLIRRRGEDAQEVADT